MSVDFLLDAFALALETGARPTQGITVVHEETVVRSTGRPRRVRATAALAHDRPRHARRAEDFPIPSGDADEDLQWEPE